MGGEISYENKQNKSRVKLSACNRQPKEKEKNSKKQKVNLSFKYKTVHLLSLFDHARTAENLLAFSWFQESVQLKNVTQMFQNLEISTARLKNMQIFGLAAYTSEEFQNSKSVLSHQKPLDRLDFPEFIRLYTHWVLRCLDLAFFDF